MSKPLEEAVEAFINDYAFDFPEKAREALAALLAQCREGERNKTLEDAAQVVARLNEQGPYEAVGAPTALRSMKQEAMVATVFGETK